MTYYIQYAVKEKKVISTVHLEANNLPNSRLQHPDIPAVFIPITGIEKKNTNC